jgi:hypothetical protein
MDIASCFISFPLEVVQKLDLFNDLEFSFWLYYLAPALSDTFSHRIQSRLVTTLASDIGGASPTVESTWRCQFRSRNPCHCSLDYRVLDTK